MLQRVENYEQAIDYLYGRINFERIAASYSVADFRLDRMRLFLELLGDPQLDIPAIHIAGTKGKGSTAALLAGTLTAASYRTGLFTSPHISAFEERIAVNGVSPTPEQLVELVNAVIPFVAELDEHPGKYSPTYFEIATALAWMFFREQHVAAAVLEVGLGGRLDATNLCRPAACIITSISRDHMLQLGSRIEQIAAEKAGIIKPGVPVVSGVTNEPARSVIVGVCAERQSPLFQLERDFQFVYRPASPRLPDSDGGPCAGEVQVVTTGPAGRSWPRLPLQLAGEHQARNAALVVAAIEQLQQAGWTIADEAVRQGFANLRWPARIEVLRREPFVIVDAAHNWAAIGALLKTLAESFRVRRKILVFAATQDKDVAGLLRRLLPQFDTVILTSYQSNPRTVAVEDVLRLTQSLTERPVHVAPDPAAAWKAAERFAGPEDLICVTGSFFIAAELRELILDGSAPAAVDGKEHSVSPQSR